MPTPTGCETEPGEGRCRGPNTESHLRAGNNGGGENALLRAMSRDVPVATAVGKLAHVLDVAPVYKHTGTPHVLLTFCSVPAVVFAPLGCHAGRSTHSVPSAPSGEPVSARLSRGGVGHARAVKFSRVQFTVVPHSVTGRTSSPVPDAALDGARKPAPVTVMVAPPHGAPNGTAASRRTAAGTVHSTTEVLTRCRGRVEEVQNRIRSGVPPGQPAGK